MCIFSTRTSLNSSWLPQKRFLTVAEAVNLQLLAYLEGTEDLHPKSNPSLSATNVLLISENSSFSQGDIQLGIRKSSVLWISQGPFSFLLQKAGQEKKINYSIKIELPLH